LVELPLDFKELELGLKGFHAIVVDEFELV
jgi:hypothetical protein